MAREVLGVIGAAVGYYFGGPVGAQIGYTIGSEIGGAIDPEKIPAVGLSDAPVQTGRTGVIIPVIWGVKETHGNIIQKNPERQWSTWESAGKGSGPKVETRHRSRTFAIGVCEGPIMGIRRIWENGQLVFDQTLAPRLMMAETDKFANDLIFYLGGEDQMPDPELEAHWGTDETPYYRGLAYVLFKNKETTNTGGAIPQYMFEVDASGEILGTSHVYPYEFTDGTENSTINGKAFLFFPPSDGVENAVVVGDGIMNNALTSYQLWPPEGVANSAVAGNAILNDALTQYAMQPEAVENAAAPQDGLLSASLVQYTIPTEGIQNSATPEDGTLA